MSAPPKDLRPKVINLSNPLYGLNIAARQSVLWPCHAFSISIPKKRKRDLNVFEETVLKITEIDSKTDKIAELTCLENELVSFIQSRLRQIFLIDKRNEPTLLGRKLLREWQNESDDYSNNNYEFSEIEQDLQYESDYESDDNSEYTVATVFVDLLSGQVLPYISTEQLTYEKITNIGNEKFVDFLTDPKNEKSRVRARHIPLSKDSYWNVVPRSSDIIRAIKDFKKNYKKYALLNPVAEHYPPPVPMAKAISLHDKPEMVFLHCVALIQIGNSDLLVTDGFGCGFSESFASYLTSQSWPWVTELKRKGLVEEISSENSADERVPGKAYRYVEISRRIKNSQSSLYKIKELVPDSSNYEREYEREIESGIKNLYAGLEWALRQIVAEFPVPEWEEVLSSRNFRENEKLLCGFARKIGFSVTGKTQSLLQVKTGALRQIEQGKVEFQPLLALSVAGANCDANHPMHTLAKNHSDFLGFSLKLKSYRDPIEHGGIDKLKIDKDILEMLIEKTVPIIMSLVPGVADDLELYIDNRHRGDINQDRLKANIRLEKALGLAFLHNLPPVIKELLVRSETMLAQYSEEISIEIIKCYASTMQQLLVDIVKDRKVSDEFICLKEKAIEKVIQSGFYCTSDAIPKQISTVNDKRLYHAAQGSSTTLGAHLLSTFLLGDENELVQLRNSDAEFVEFVARLIQLRGHGNKTLHKYTRENIELLREDLFNKIKIVSEVF